MKTIHEYLDTFYYALDNTVEDDSPEMDYIKFVIKYLELVRFETEDVDAKNPDKLGTTIALQRLPGLDLLARIYA